MRSERIREYVTELTAEGADVAAITEAMLAENDADYAEIDANVEALAKLTEDVARLNKTNLELLDQIRDGFNAGNSEEEEPEIYTVEELFAVEED